MTTYQFIEGPWENSELPTIVKENPNGGDPYILATIKRVHNPDGLYELCRRADLVEPLVEALRSIRQYGSDTLSGRVDGPDDRQWQRESVLEMTRRARTALQAYEAGQ